VQPPPRSEHVEEVTCAPSRSNQARFFPASGSDDDQIVPIGASGLMTAKIVKNATLKVYPGFPHGMPTTNADQINADMLAFIKKSQQVAAG
jgi:pimeloyl-ACP methyl ester carboxylesterase